MCRFFHLADCYSCESHLRGRRRAAKFSREVQPAELSECIVTRCSTCRGRRAGTFSCSKSLLNTRCKRVCGVGPYSHHSRSSVVQRLASANTETDAGCGLIESTVKTTRSQSVHRTDPIWFVFLLSGSPFFFFLCRWRWIIYPSIDESRWLNSIRVGTGAQSCSEHECASVVFKRLESNKNIFVIGSRDFGRLLKTVHCSRQSSTLTHQSLLISTWSSFPCMKSESLELLRSWIDAGLWTWRKN